MIQILHFLSLDGKDKKYKEPKLGEKIKFNSVFLFLELLWISTFKIKNLFYLCSLCFDYYQNKFSEISFMFARKVLLETSQFVNQEIL